MTIRGIEQTVEFDVDFGGLIKDKEGATHAGFTLHGKIDRTRFGMVSNEMVDGVPLISKEIKFTINLHLLRSE